MTIDREVVELLLRENSEISMDRLIYREALEVKPRNLDGSRNCQDAIKNKERRPGRKRIYWGFVEKLSSLKKTYKDKEKTTHVKIGEEDIHHIYIYIKDKYNVCKNGHKTGVQEAKRNS